ncbi:MAG: sulfite exporter TauE/SafE family protein [Prevotella sp.]|jgi:uncharacterized membrane protein YfcA|nr:sulfite exporter TauE/SafE family protein [Prevotella sp.]
MSKKAVISIWLICLLVAAATAVLSVNNVFAPLDIPEWLIIILLVVLSAFCEYIDSSLGMGYGTTLTPVLLTFGVVRIDIVPAILLSELLTGFFSGVAHHREGNIDLLKNKSVRTTLYFLALPSLAGVIIATLLGTKLQSQNYINLYIAIMIVCIGMYLIYSNFFVKKPKHSLSRIRLLLLGTVAAFNKGLSGGGYGPLMTGGQLTAGVKEKEAVAITSVCEGFTCLVGLIAFFMLGGKLNLFYAIPLCLGSMLSVIPAAKTIKILPEGMLRKTIGWATLLLGLLVLYKYLN